MKRLPLSNRCQIALPPIGVVNAPTKKTKKSRTLAQRAAVQAIGSSALLVQEGDTVSTTNNLAKIMPTRTRVYAKRYHIANIKVIRSHVQ